MKLFDQMNWQLLRKQKQILVEIIGNFTAGGKHNGEYTEALEGILNLIDAVQDCAVDDLGVDSETVFNFAQFRADHELPSLAELDGAL